MKKVFKISVLAALLFSSLVSATNDSRVKLTSGENKSLIFTVDTQFQKTNIKMLAESGELVFAENVIGESLYSKRFNLKNLKEGSYLFVVENSLKEVVYDIEISESDAKIIERKENAKPVFRNKEGVLYMNLLNLDKQNVKIKVYDSDNRILFEETISDEMLIEKAFNFVNALEDSYIVAVQDSKNTYYEVVLVK